MVQPFVRAGLLTLVALSLLHVSTWASSPSPRPNILVLLVDDMGYSDLGCYGGEIATPHIDRLAAGGVRFTQFYNASRCCQTRASLLTGAYPHRVGMADFGKTMDPTVTTLPENLKQNGYTTAMVGKWHLSALPQEPRGERRLRWMNHQLELDRPFVEPASLPTRRGFERFYGIAWGVVDHFDPFSLLDGEKVVRDVPNDFYITGAITETSVKYLSDFAQDDKPFFLYVAYTAPHWPLHAPREAIAKYRGRYNEGWHEIARERFERQKELGLFSAETPRGEPSGGRRWEDISGDERDYLAAKMEVHAAMVDCVDQSVGKIVEALEQNGQLENTLILFLSDNGASPEIPMPPGYDRHSETRDGRSALREGELKRPENRDKLGSDESYAGIGPGWASAVNTPLRWWKAESYEGGCRTPLVVHWPAGQLAHMGGWNRTPGHVIDIATTCYELAGAELVETTLKEGESLVEALRTGESAQPRTLFFDHQKGHAIRVGKWKAVKRADSPWQLFDMSSDPGETDDLAGSEPERLEGMVGKWEKWKAEVGPGP
jgi:arylsulfatase A-like enzyme